MCWCMLRGTLCRTLERDAGVDNPEEEQHNAVDEVLHVVLELTRGRCVCVCVFAGIWRRGEWWW